MAAKAGAIRAGRAFVELFADDSALQRGLKRAQARLRAFGTAVTNVGAKLAGIGTAALGALGLATKAFANAGDELQKMSIRTGISVENLSQLGFAAEQSGSNLGELSNAVLRMNRRLGRITAGQASKTQEEALKALGLGAKELERLSPEERLLAIADAMAAMEDKSEAAGLAQRAFGTQVDAIIPLLLEGRAGIEALKNEADALGLTLSADQANAAAAFTDAWNRVRRQLKQVVIQIGGALAPVITDLAGRITPIVRTVIDWVRQNAGLITTVAGVAAAVAGAGGLLIALGGALKLAAVAAGLASTALAAIGTVLGVLLNPVTLIIAAVGTLGAIIIKESTAGQKAIEFLKQKFGPLAETAMAAFGAIRDALASGEIGKAAEILWATLKLAFVSGITFLKTKWIDLKVTLLNAFIDLWSKLPEGWQNAIKAMAGMWVSFVGGVRKAWTEAQSFLTVQFAKLFGAGPEEIARLKDEGTAAVRAIDQATKRQRESLERTLEKMAEDPEGAKAELRGRAEKERAKLQAELQKARGELDRLIEEGSRTPAVAQKPDIAKKQQQAQAAAADVASGRARGGLASVQATSAEGLRIIAETLRRGRRDPQEETARNTKQILVEERQQTELLRRSGNGTRVVSIGNA